MANVEKIDQLVDSAVPKQVSDLKEGLTGLNTTMITVLESTAKMYAEIGKIDAIKQVVAANNQYAESTKKLKEVEAQFLSQSEKLRIAEEKLANQRQSGGASKLSAYEKELNAQRNASEKQAARIRIAEEQLNAVMQRQASTSAEAIAQNKQLRAAILNLNPAWESEKQKIEQINAVINRNDDLITANGDNMVKQKRNIGNYASGFSPLNNAMAQLTREGPAFANSINTGFMAISNNLPILADAIQQVKMQNAALRAEGQPTTSVFKQIVSSLFSWQTALSLGVVLLTVYGKEMVNWIASLFESEKALNANTMAMTAMNAAKTKGIQDSQKERIELKLLYEAATDDTKSREERLSATNELQKQYPAYFKNLSDENIMVGNAEKTYNILTTALIKNAIAKAKVSELDKLATQGWDLSMKAAGKLMEVEDARSVLQYQVQERTKVYAETENKAGQARANERKQANIEVKSAQDRVASLIREYNNLTSSIRSTDKAQIQLSKSINVTDLNLDVKGEKPKATPKPDNTLENNRKALENNRKALENSLEEERKLRINASKIIYTDENKSYDERFEALNKYIADSKSNIVASANAEIETENNKYKTQSKNKKLSSDDKIELEKLHTSQLNVITEKAKQEQINIESEGEKTRTSILNKQYEDSKKALDNEIKMMENGYDKEAAIRSKSATDSLVKLAIEYKNGKISKEEYESGKLKVTQEYINEELRLQLDLAKKEANLLSGDDKKNKLKEIAQIEASISKNNIKNLEEQAKKDEDLKNKRIDNLNEYADKAKEGISAITGFVNALYEGEINKIEEDQQAYDDAAQAKIAIIEDQESKGTISSETATARKKAITDAQTKYDAEADKKKTALKKKQAIMDKVAAIAQASINTAIGITNALSKVITIPLVPYIAAMGAIEIATIVATPLAYKKGTPKGGHKGGDALVGDGGKSEMMITSEGIFKTPAKPTFIQDLEEGAVVLPDYNEATKMLLNSSLYHGSGVSPIYDDRNVTNKMDLMTNEIKGLRGDLKKSKGRNYSSDMQFIDYKNRILR